MAETAGTKGLTATTVKNARAKDKAYKLRPRWVFTAHAFSRR